jgi:hypothetical protein
MDARFTTLEQKMDRGFEAMLNRFDAMDTKFWRLTGILVTTMAGVLAVAGGLLAALLR